MVGDGEAETGPLAASWHSNKFLNPAHDGAVLPILHLNGYKIASPPLLARIPGEELDQLFRGYGALDASQGGVGNRRYLNIVNTLKKGELDHLARVLMDRKGPLPRSTP